MKFQKQKSWHFLKPSPEATLPAGSKLKIPNLIFYLQTCFLWFPDLPAHQKTFFLFEKKKGNNRHCLVSTGFSLSFFFLYPWGCRVALLQLIPSDTEPQEQKKPGGWLKRSVIPFFIRNSSLQIHAYSRSRPRSMEFPRQFMRPSSSTATSPL